jgi:hypothetical protein
MAIEMSDDPEIKAESTEPSTLPVEPEAPPEVLCPKNGLFKIIPRGDTKDSPNFTFTWEITKEAEGILLERKARKPFLLVIVTESFPPDPQEEHNRRSEGVCGEKCGCPICLGWIDKISETFYCLHEGAGQIQFVRNGKYRLYFLIVWSETSWSQPSWSKSREDILYHNHFEAVTRPNFPGHGPRLEHVEEIDVQITASLFATKPNEFGWWWANLWFEVPPRNQCFYRRRLLLISLPQALFLLCYVPLRGLCGLLGLVGLLLVGFKFKHLHLEPVYRPFSTTLDGIKDTHIPGDNYAFYNTKGKDRASTLSIVARLPVLWVMLAAISFALYRSSHLVRSYVGCLSVWVAAIAFLVWVGYHTLKRLKLNQVPDYQWYITQRVSKLEPPDPTRTKSVPLYVRYLDLKHRVCLPYAINKPKRQSPHDW